MTKWVEITHHGATPNTTPYGSFSIRAIFPFSANSMKGPIGVLASKSIPVVFYDQIGCGESTRLPEKKGDGNFWTLELFIKDLENVIAALNIDQYDLFGHSWGGLLAVSCLDL
jgi:pimeloyl-ACP methyl ester carboxylesterase